MRISIRESVFETNSSSMHTIAVRKRGKKIPIGKGMDTNYISLWDGRYSIYDEDDISFERWPFKILTTFMEKMLYYIASVSWKHEKDIEDWLKKEIYPIIKKYYHEFKYIEFPLEGYYISKKFYGYVDHESNDLMENFLRSRNISLEDFCADNKYVIFIDGDEYNFVEKYMKDGLLHSEDYVELVKPWDFYNENGDKL